MRDDPIKEGLADYHRINLTKDEKEEDRRAKAEDDQIIKDMMMCLLDMENDERNRNHDPRDDEHEMESDYDLQEDFHADEDFYDF